MPFDLEAGRLDAQRASDSVRVKFVVVDAEGCVRPRAGSVSVVDFGNTVAPILREVLMLGEQEREALFLVYVEQLTYRQAAEMLEVPIGTVMTRLATARERAMLTSRPANIFGDASGLC